MDDVGARTGVEIYHNCLYQREHKPLDFRVLGDALRKYDVTFHVIPLHIVLLQCMRHDVVYAHFVGFWGFANPAAQAVEIQGEELG